MAMLARSSRSSRSDRIVAPSAGALLRAWAACFGVPGGESDDRRHDDAPVLRQPLGDACGAALVTETEADAGFELVGLGEKDGVVRS